MLAKNAKMRLAHAKAYDKPVQPYMCERLDVFVFIESTRFIRS